MSKLITLKPRLQTLKASGLQTLSINPQTASASWRNDKQTSAQRGYGYKWQQARIGWLRAHPLCVMCEAMGRVIAASVVDHKVPHRGNKELFWNRNNWQSLCQHHHSSDAQIRDRGL
ncbi:HNH endonuclease [Undibacterium sp.]|uniref:HNH endonuclease n=1 Tax=Undibacterium sp. TaxID=1914977 RepID=UPI0037501EE0